MKTRKRITPKLAARIAKLTDDELGEAVADALVTEATIQKPTAAAGTSGTGAALPPQRRGPRSAMVRRRR